ncbi:hypothetical protein GCM10009744_47820 [Kribbella alba]|uniref:Uncharacterized protein n=1 Tax=Kribbella alba TaxID=190197 RepID=A0ABN2FK06_9ACTN
MADQTAWAVVAAFVTGAGLDALRGSIASRHAKKARAAERDSLFDDRQADFERNTLLEYEQVIEKLTRLTARVHLAYEKEYRSTGHFARSQLPDELGGDTGREISEECSRLSSRIIDDDIRTLASKLQGMCRAVIHTFQCDEEIGGDVREQNRSEFNQAMSMALEMREAIGAKLRELYLRR